MTKPSLLFLAHRIPYPPNKGDKIRSFNLLKALARDYQIYLGTFVDDPEDWKYEEDLRDYCSEMFILGLTKLRKYTALKGFISNDALSIPYYRFSQMQKWVDRKIRDHEISRVFVYSSAMAQYVSGESYSSLHRVIDFVDVDSEKWREYSRRCKFPMNLIYRREAKKLFSFDKKIANEFDASLFVSSEEAALFRKLVASDKANIDYLNNGVDYHYFDPDVGYDRVYPKEQKVIVFTGAMDYWANVDAVTWFANKIFPQIRERVPNTHFYIVGARPTEEVAKLESDTVHVVGAVKDIRPYIATADCSVAPMRIARGVQNKVLEALALKTPVVATQAAMEGIELPEGQHIYDNEADIADQVVSLIQSSVDQSLVFNGRQRILDDFSWDTNLKKLEHLLGDDTGSSSSNPGKHTSTIPSPRTTAA